MNCFSVQHKDGVLDLVAPDEDTRDIWVIGLRFALVSELAALHVEDVGWKRGVRVCVHAFRALIC